MVAARLWQSLDICRGTPELRCLWSRLRTDRNESEQGFVRIAWGIIAGLWVGLTTTATERGESFPLVLTAFFVCSVLLLGWMSWQPGANALRRHCAMACDGTFMCLFIFLCGPSGAFLWSIGPFICIGYGFRYGPGYLTTCFLFVILADGTLLLHPTWQNETWMFIGLLAHLLLIVPYSLVLLRRIWRLNASLQQANETKSRILSAHSHNMRTPIGAIMANLSLAMSEAEPRVRHSHLESAWSASTVLLRQISNSLTLAALDQGQPLPPPEPVFLREVTESLLAIIGPKAAERGLELRYHYDVALPDQVLVALPPLQEALVALLDNAVKYTLQGYIALELRAEGEHSVRIQVSDSGRGIAALDLEHVFERFWQGTDPQTLTERGSGLGTAIAREMVESAGGAVGVSSRMGVGSQFWIVLPMGRLASDAKQPIQSRGAVMPSVMDGVVPFASSAQTLRVLLAEDEPATRRLLEKVLLAAGHEVLAVADGGAVRFHLETGTFDAVVLDCHLPGATGLDLIAQWRIRSKRRPRFILLTADVTTATRQMAAAVGADVFLEKPIDSATVLRALTAAGPGRVNPRVGQNSADGSTAAWSLSEGTPIRSEDTFDRTERSLLRSAESTRLSQPPFPDPAILAIARQSIAQSLANARGAVVSGKLTEALEWVHRLRGTALLIGAHEAAQLALEFTRGAAIAHRLSEADIQRIEVAITLRLRELS